MDDPIGELITTGEVQPQQKKKAKRTTRGGKKTAQTAVVPGQEAEAAAASQQPQELDVAPLALKKRKKRGPTRGLKANRGPPTKPLQFNEFDQPVGTWKKDFTSFARHLVSSYCNINHNWNEVPIALKDQIFERLQVFVEFRSVF